MASNKKFSFTGVALTATTTTNLLNPPTATGGVNAGSSPNYIVLNHVRVMNRTNAAVPVGLWVGATGANTAGTESIWAGTASAGALTAGVSVPANSYLDWYGSKRLDSTQFLVGGAGSANALTLEGEGEIGVA